MIDLFFHILKKLMFTAVFVIFAFVATYIPQPDFNNDGHTNVEVAHAQWTVWDPGNYVPNWGGFIENTIQTGTSLWRTLKEEVLDPIAWAVAKQIISNMIGSVVDWINSGFQGSPAFIQDLEGFLLQAADQAVGQYINDLGDIGSFVCSPFRLDVQLSVALQYDLDRTNDVAACTLTGVINNFQGFLDGTVNSNDLGDWLSLVHEPQSTPLGSVFAAKAGARRSLLNAQGEELSLLGFGDGFLSGELCQTANGPNGPQQDCFITKPGKMLQEALTFNLDSGRQTLVEADEFNEIIVALLGQLANQAISGAAGLLGLSSGTGYTYTGYSRGSFTADLSDGSINVGTSPRVAGGTQNTTGPAPSTNPGVAAAQNIIAQGLQSQQTVLGNIGTYIQSLTNVANNPLNSTNTISAAQLAVGEASNILNQVAADVNAITPLASQFSALEAEFPTATPTRQNQIRSIQTQLIQQFSALSLISSQQYSLYTSRWDTIIASDVSGNNNGLTPRVFP